MSEVQLPVKFYSKIKDHVILMKDREVIYQGNKMIEVKPTTKIKFVSGTYSCTDLEVYEFLMKCKQFKHGILLIEPPKVKSMLAPAITFTQKMLGKFNVEELASVLKSFGSELKDGAIKEDVVKEILAHQDGAEVVAPEAPATAAKGVVTNETAQHSIKVEGPQVD